MNTSEVAKLLNVSRQSIYNWLKSDQAFRDCAEKNDQRFLFDIEKVRVWYKEKTKPLEF